MTTSILRAVECSAAGAETVLELPIDDVEELLSEVRRRWPRPDATLWAGSTPDELAAVGWIAAVPGSSGRRHETVLGQLTGPGDYVQITATDPDGASLLESWITGPDARAALERSGLLPDRDTAARGVATLRERLDVTRGSAGPVGGAARRALDHGATARRLGALHLAAEAWCRAGTVLHEVGEQELSLRLHRWGLGALLTSERPAGVARCRGDIGHALWHTGHPTLAIAELEHALALLADAGQDEEVQRLQLQLSVPLADTGRTDEALALIRADDSADMAGDDGARRARNAYACAYVLRAAGRSDEALTHGKQALAMTLDHGSLSSAADVHALLAELFAEAGDFTAATNHRTAIKHVEVELRRTVGI